MSKFLYQNSVFKDRRRSLRNNTTKEEKLLWDYLKNSNLGVKFTRQYSAGPYILDFYCPKLRLAVELDGSQHNMDENILYDKERENYLNSINIKTIRFWNNEITKNISKVLDDLRKEITQTVVPLLT